MTLRFEKPQSLDKSNGWRYCRAPLPSGKKCGQAFQMWSGSRTRCRDCWKREHDEKVSKRKAQRQRAGAYVKPKPEFWGRSNRKRQVEEAGARCEVCKRLEKEQIEKFGCGLTRDHILPVRLVQILGLGDPHLDLNICMICSECHGIKRRAENFAFDGDFISFVTELKKIGWDMEELQMVLIHYNLGAVAFNENLFPKSLTKHAT